MSASPLNPDDVGSVSSAGNSSTRTYLSGSSSRSSNSIGTRLSPRTRRVRPVAMTVFTSSSFCPPIAVLAAASTSSAFLADSALGGALGAWANATTVRAIGSKPASAASKVLESHLLISRVIGHQLRPFVSFNGRGHSTAAFTALASAPQHSPGTSFLRNARVHGMAPR